VSDVDPSGVDAVILVGGKGTRLRPLTLSAAKPMLPTAGLPFLTHLLSRIADAGIEHVILGTSYKAATFENEFGDGSNWACRSNTSPRSIPSVPAAVSPTSCPSCATHRDGVQRRRALRMDLRQMLSSHHASDADLTCTSCG